MDETPHSHSLGVIKYKKAAITSSFIFIIQDFVQSPVCTGKKWAPPDNLVPSATHTFLSKKMSLLLVRWLDHDTISYL